jgi:hypothetical protein
MRRAFTALRILAKRHAAFIVGVGLVFTFCRWPALTGWDEGFYVAQLTSVVADRDLLLHNDLLLLDNPLAQKLRMLTTVAQDGALLNTFSVGPAVLHAGYAWPLLIAARPTPWALRAAFALGSLALLALTVLAMTALAERLGFARPVARIAAVLAIALGPLALFGTRAAVNSHLPSALLAAVFCLSCLAWLDRALPRHALAAGLTAGLLTITRWQEAVFLLALAPALLMALSRGDSRVRRAGGAALAAGAFALVLSLQLVAWRIQFGHWLLVPQGGGYMHWTRPAILPLLLSSYHGLIPWMPGFALGLVGLLWLRPSTLAPERRLFAWGLIALAPISLYLSACPSDWWGGDSFGPRRLASLTPLVALGLAQVLTSLARWRARWFVIGGLCLWAVFALTAQLSGFDDLSVVFFGRVSPWSPLSIDAYSAARWIDHWPTWPRLLRPGFTLSDAPRLPDRFVGLAIVPALVAAVTLLWTALRRSAMLQRIALGLGLAWVGVALIWTTRLPLDAAWNSEWRQTVRGENACTPTNLPSQVLSDAHHVLCAARAIRAGDQNAARAHLARVRHAAEYGLDEQALRIAVERNGLGEP